MEAPKTMMTNMTQKLDAQRKTQLDALTGDEKAKAQMEAQAFFSGSGGRDFSNVNNLEEKILALNNYAEY